MLNISENIGYELLKSRLGQNFTSNKSKIENQKMFSDIDEFYLSINNSKFQFEGFLLPFIHYIEKIEDNNEKKLMEVFMSDCLQYMVIINFLFFLLNNYIINGEVLEIVDCNYYPVIEKLDKTIIKNDNLVKEAFECIYGKDDEMFNLFFKLKNTFHNSDMFKDYLSSPVDNIELHRNKILTLFYLIRQCIYQITIDGEISMINNEENIISYESSTLFEKGKFFKIRYQNFKDLQYSLKGVIKIKEGNEIETGFITTGTLRFSDERGSMAYIKGWILAEDGFELKNEMNNDLKNFLPEISELDKIYDMIFSYI